MSPKNPYSCGEGDERRGRDDQWSKIGPGKGGVDEVPEQLRVDQLERDARQEQEGEQRGLAAMWTDVPAKERDLDVAPRHPAKSRRVLWG